MALQKRAMPALKIMIRYSIVILCVLIYIYSEILELSSKSDRNSDSLSNTELLMLSASTTSNDNDKNIQQISLNECKYGILSKYGVKFDEDVAIRLKRKKFVNISHAFGCSKNVKYCKGKIKSIPCCIKIMYDIWYALDTYLVKYNITYSVHWGSLLFAVRDGRHGPWDAKDIDLGFLWPPNTAKQVIKEFINDYKLSMDGIHHIMDWNQNFYRYHHRKYEYPSNEKKYCFYNQIMKSDHGPNDTMIKKTERKKLNEILKNEDALILGGTNAFIDFAVAGIKTDGMGNYAKHIEHDIDKLHREMIQVKYEGSNGILPPRNIYVFPDYYKQLYHLYWIKGYDDWTKGYDRFLTDKQLKYYGMKKFDNSYFKSIYKNTLLKLSQIKKYKKRKTKDERKMLNKFKHLKFV